MCLGYLPVTLLYCAYHDDRLNSGLVSVHRITSRLRLEIRSPSVSIPGHSVSSQFMFIHSLDRPRSLPRFKVSSREIIHQPQATLLFLPTTMLHVFPRGFAMSFQLVFLLSFEVSIDGTPNSYRYKYNHTFFDVPLGRADTCLGVSALHCHGVLSLDSNNQ